MGSKHELHAQGICTGIWSSHGVSLNLLSTVQIIPILELVYLIEFRRRLHLASSLHRIGLATWDLRFDLEIFSRPRLYRQFAFY